MSARRVWIYRGDAPSTRAEREALQAALRAGGQRRDRDSGRPDRDRPPSRRRRGGEGPGSDEGAARSAAPEVAATAGEEG